MESDVSSTGLLVGIDVGGTFTDCAVVEPGGGVRVGKALTTKRNFLDGVAAAMEAALGYEVAADSEPLLAPVDFIKHGTTVGTNAIIERGGCRVGVLVTKGFEDTLTIMRAHGRHVDLTPEELINFTETAKPDPLVPRRFITGIAERVDCFGAEVVPLDEAEVRRAVEAFVEEGVEAIAVCYLWSFLDASHELRTKEIIAELAPEMFVSLSSSVAPKLGEYERSAATVVNAYLGPLMSNYLERFRESVKDRGFEKEPLIVQCAGGVVGVRQAAAEPLGTIDSGPVAGLVGSSVLAAEMGIENVVTTDMGGTSFDVGIITEGVPVKRELTLVDKYECFIPRIDVTAIGSGGGSIVWVDEQGRLNVGPQSAGSDPGPAFFGRGGEQPTVADANLLLGFLDPSYFFGGKLDVDRNAAEAAMARIAEQLGVDDVLEVAAGVVTITEHKMADLIRKVTIEQGFDVREFVAFAYGGSSAIHAAAYSRALGIEQVVVPLARASSVWSAAGAAAANIVRVLDRPVLMDSPLEMDEIRRVFAELVEDVRAQLEAEGVRPEARRFDRYALMRHKAQVYEVPIPIDEELLAGEGEKLVETFEQRYEALYGRGSAFSAGGITVATLRVEAFGIVFEGTLRSDVAETEEIDPAAELPSRSVFWPERREASETAIYLGPALRPGNRIEGPAIVQSAETTVVVPHGDSLGVDGFGNYVLQLVPEERRVTGQATTGGVTNV